MSKRKAPNLTDFAKAAAVDASGAHAVGDWLETIDENDSTWSFLFASKLKGYLDWRWSVTIFAPAKGEPTVSEVVLMPGEDSLLAPSWVPWADRLADWKALQAELEAQAAAEAAEAAEADNEEEEAIVDDIVDVELKHDESLEDAEESALLDPEEGVDAEDDSNDAGPRPPRSRGRNRRRKNNKNRQGQTPQNQADEN